jgi:DNA-3-methyladenine glycosylase II
MIKSEREIAITPSGPFSWPAALGMLSGWEPMLRHARGGASVTRLAFPLDGDFRPVAVALRDDGGVLRGDVAGTDRLDAVAAQVARTFSLDHDGTGYPSVGERDPAVGRLMAALPGLRPVCFTSPYEAAAWAVLSGRTSMAQAATTLDALLVEYGHPLRVAGAEVRAFPEPDRLLRATAIRGVGAEKLARLHGVARAALDGRLDAARLRELGDEAGPASLRTIRGIGEFWSQGIYLRGCGIRDAFPVEPLSIAALGHLHGLGDRPSPDAIRRLTEPHRPYRMWVCFLLRVAAGRGLVGGIAGREREIRAAWVGPRPSASSRSGSGGGPAALPARGSEVSRPGRARGRAQPVRPLV